METFSSNLAKIYNENALVKYFGITAGELRKSQVCGSLFGVRAPSHFAMDNIVFYLKEEIDRFLANFIEQPGDGL